jgi:hypothetical protein
MKKRATEISIQFKQPPLLIFNRMQSGNGPCAEIQPNLLTIRIQPDEGIALRFGAKVPNTPNMAVCPVNMDFDYSAAFGTSSANGYERLLLDFAAQAKQLLTPSPAFFNGPSLKLANALVANSCFDQVFFANSGAEANEGAIKLVDQFETVTLELQRPSRLCAPANKNGEDPTAPSVRIEIRPRGAVSPPLATCKQHSGT